MNAYVFDVFITHSIVMEDFEEDGIYTTTCDLVEVGPLNIPDFNKFRRIKKIVRDISSTQIASNWWSDFSTWEDFSGILRTGTKLSMHLIVQEINSKLENNTSYEDLIDNNNNQIYFISKILVEHSTIQPYEHLKCPKQIAQFYALCPILTLVLQLNCYTDRDHSSFSNLVR